MDKSKCAVTYLEQLEQRIEELEDRLSTWIKPDVYNAMMHTNELLVEQLQQELETVKHDKEGWYNADGYAEKCKELAQQLADLREDRAHRERIHHGVKKQLADVQAENEWISVDERLPKTGTQILCYEPDAAPNDIFQWDSDSMIDDHSCITHWMPLTEPPTQDGR